MNGCLQSCYFKHCSCPYSKDYKHRILEAWEATGWLRPIQVMADLGSARTDSHGRLQAHTQFVCHSRSWLARVLAEFVKKVIALEQEIACIESWRPGRLLGVDSEVLARAGWPECYRTVCTKCCPYSKDCRHRILEAWEAAGSRF